MTLLSFSVTLYAQTPLIQKDSINQKARTRIISLIGASAYTGTMLMLGAIWYADSPSSGFHFLNDHGAWLGMDKLGHAMATFQLSRATAASLRWAGLPTKKAAWYGGGLGLLAITSIEIFDGFSEEWGASPTDALANLGGAVLYTGQALFWKQPRFLLKWSYHDSGFAQYRPNALGASFNERWLKDYNGQTYWLSGNIASFLKEESRFPKWLNIAVGYGANGVLGAYENPEQVDGIPLPHFERYRQYYLSLDVDLSRIHTRSRLLNTLLFLGNSLKVPFPSLEYNRINGLKGHWLFF